ncbi:MAG: hypothetical protein R3Y24_15835 [Eubacteriales bacterium]
MQSNLLAICRIRKGISNIMLEDNTITMSVKMSAEMETEGMVFVTCS